MNLFIMMSEIGLIPGPVKDVLLPILMALMVIASLALIVIILMQKGTSSNVGVIGGGDTETYMGQNKGKTKESILKKMTYIFGAVLLVISIAFFIIQAI
ncbi:MAG: preprotein translocase subunit SecG [Clostridia bacterium]